MLKVQFVCFSIFLAKPPQNLYFSPIIVACDDLMQIVPQTAKIWPFVGRIWSVFDPCKIEEKSVESPVCLFFNLFCHVTSENFSWTNDSCTLWFDEIQARSSQDLDILSRIWCVFEPCEQSQGSRAHKQRMLNT